MKYCQLCKSPIQPNLILCSMCISRLAERAIGPQIQSILKLLQPPEVITEIKQAIDSVSELMFIEDKERDESLSLSNQVKMREKSWQTSRSYEESLKHLISNLGPVEAFPAIILIAITGRRYYRRYLRRRFKFDPKRIQFFKGEGYPSPSREEKLWRLAWHRFVFYHTMFDVCIKILFFNRLKWKEPAKGTELSEAITEAVNAVGRLIESAPLLVAQGMTFPSQVIQQEATFSTAAWVKTRLSLEKNLRLRSRLSEDGEHPGDKLREELPSNVFQAYCSTDWKDVKAAILQPSLSIHFWV